jgi:hypothetical protein
MDQHQGQQDCRQYFETQENSHLNYISFFTYDFSKLKQDHADLKHCRFYHLSQELLSIIWQIVLKRKSQDLDTVLILELNGLGRLSG